MLTFPPECNVVFPLARGRYTQSATFRDEGQELVRALAVHVGLPDGPALTQHDVGAGQ